MLSKFDEMHECAEWVAGHPIWTHEFASHALNVSLRDAVLAQHPILAGADVDALRVDLAVSDDKEATCRDWIASEARRIKSDTVTLRRGTTERTQSPLETLAELAPNKPIIPVVF